MKIRPLHDRVLVKPLEDDSKTPGGLHIPDTAKDRPTKALVVAVGPGERDERGRRLEPDVKAGDVVLFGKYSGIEVTIDGVRHLAIREQELVAVIEG